MRKRYLLEMRYIDEQGLCTGLGMERGIFMTRENLSTLEKIVRVKSKEFNFTNMKLEHSASVIPMLREDWHLFMQMESPILPPLSLQMAIYAEETAVRMLLFPSPIIINRENVNEFIRLSNVANRYLYRGTALGRFWVDEEKLDFAYEVILKESLAEHCTEEVSWQMFDIPCSHYRDLHTPLVMLAEDIWKSETAIRYLTELRDNGYVDNSEYGLW